VLGTITVSDSNVTAELRDVPAADGADVVAFIRSLTEPRASVPPARRWPNYAAPTGYESGLPGDTGPVGGSGYLPAASSPALRAVPTQSGAERSGSIGGLTRATAQHSAAEQSGTYPTQAEHSGGYPTQVEHSGAYPTQVDQSGGYPTEQSGAYPTQVEHTGGYPPQIDQSGGYPTQVEHTGGYPTQIEHSGAYPTTQVEHSGGYPTQAAYPAQSEYAGQAQYPSQGDYPNHGGYPGQPSYAARAEYPSQARHTGQTPYAAPAQYAPSADPSAAAAALTRGAVPISVLARTTAIPAQQPAVEPTAVGQGTVEHARVEQPSLELPRVDQPSLGQARVERSGPIGSPEIMAGEVPVSQLAAEATAGDLLVDGEATVAVPRTSPEQAEQAGPTEGTATTEDDEATTATGERPKPINWTAPSESRSESRAKARRGESSEARTVSLNRPVRLEATSRPPNNSPGGRPGALARSKKWIWLGAGAAGLIGLAALGSAKLIATSESGGPAAVNPAPAAVDSAVGPTVTITKVVDGDTVEVSGAVNGVVEILGIVAPRLDKEQCGATTSKAYAVKTLNNTTVTLVTDPTQPATDRAGNKLAFLRLPNGADYSVMAVEAGMARYYESPQPVGNAAEIKAAEAQAEKKHTGLWGAPCYGSVTGTTGSASSASSTSSTSGTAGTSHSATNAVKPNSTHTSTESASDTGNG
jgi:micrococcal nuclease